LKNKRLITYWLIRYEYLSIHISLNFKGILPQKDVKYLEFIFIDKIGIAYIYL